MAPTHGGGAYLHDTLRLEREIAIATASTHFDYSRRDDQAELAWQFG